MNIFNISVFLQNFFLQPILILIYNVNHKQHDLLFRIFMFPLLFTMCFSHKFRKILRSFLLFFTYKYRKKIDANYPKFRLYKTKQKEFIYILIVSTTIYIKAIFILSNQFHDILYK